MFLVGPRVTIGPPAKWAPAPCFRGRIRPTGFNIINSHTLLRNSSTAGPAALICGKAILIIIGSLTAGWAPRTTNCRVLFVGHCHGLSESIALCIVGRRACKSIESVEEQCDLTVHVLVWVRLLSQTLISRRSFVLFINSPNTLVRLCEKTVQL